MFREWPPTRDAFKVPSAKSYSRTKMGNRQWGFSIDDDSMVFTWTKLELKPRPAAKELAILMTLMEGLDLLRRLNEDDDLAEHVPIHITRDTAGIIRDFFRDIAKEWGKHMNDTGRFILHNVPLDIVMTYPAVCHFIFCLHLQRLIIIE